MAVKTEVIIIGGGAAGMTAAIACARQKRQQLECQKDGQDKEMLAGAGKSIMILEHNEKLGRKLSATGNGKCNYTNRFQSMDCYRGTDKETIEQVLKQFGVEDTIAFFRELGIYPKEKNGYLYPFSEQAASLIEAMRLELEHLKVKIKCKEHIVKVEKQDGEFLVSTETYTYRAPKLILATGGLASSKLGSDGSGYDFAKSLGLKVTKLYPALTGLKTKEDFNALAGVRVKAQITLCIKNKKCSGVELCESRECGNTEVTHYTESGELQLVSYGISGIPVFQFSRFAAAALEEGKKVTAKIDFLPELSKEELLALCMEFKKKNAYKAAGSLFNGLLDSKVTSVLLKNANIDKNKKADALTEEEILLFCRCIKEFTCAIIDTNGFENAQVTAGGVSLEEINLDTMESKQVEGLYLTGELLDVDGICGGYNLQWAWASGYLAGCAAGK